MRTKIEYVKTKNQTLSAKKEKACSQKIILRTQSRLLRQQRTQAQEAAFQRGLFHTEWRWDHKCPLQFSKRPNLTRKSQNTQPQQVLFRLLWLFLEIYALTNPRLIR